MRFSRVGSFLGASAPRAIKGIGVKASNRLRDKRIFFIVVRQRLGCRVASDGLLSFLFSADTNRFFDRGDKHFAVADLAGFGRLDDGGHGALDAVVGQHKFDFDFWQKINGVLAAAIDFSVAFLAAKPFDFADGHPFDANVTEGVLHFLQLEWFDDSFDFFHGFSEHAYSMVTSSNANATPAFRWLPLRLTPCPSAREKFWVHRRALFHRTRAVVF